MKFVLALAAVASLTFFTGSCERHSWEDTKVLFQNEHDEEHGDEDHKKEKDKDKDH